MESDVGAELNPAEDHWIEHGNYQLGIRVNLYSIPKKHLLLKRT